MLFDDGWNYTHVHTTSPAAISKFNIYKILQQKLSCLYSACIVRARVAITHTASYKCYILGNHIEYIIFII